MRSKSFPFQAREGKASSPAASEKLAQWRSFARTRSVRLSSASGRSSRLSPTLKTGVRLAGSMMTS